METYSSQREINEAIAAGKQSLESLNEAYSVLKSAQHWGTFDYFSKGVIVNAIKHSKIQKASKIMEKSNYDLMNFAKELKDVKNIDNLSIDIGGFLTFADFFMDGILVDFMVQSKIKKAEKTVKSAIEKVEYILSKLQALK